MYKKTEWVDHVVDEDGNIIQQGTPLDQVHMNNIEDGIAQNDSSIGTLAETQATQGETQTTQGQNLQTLSQEVADVKSGDSAFTSVALKDTVTDTNFKLFIQDGKLFYEEETQNGSTSSGN